MYREESKFLDLDMVAERILDSGDREMFCEAVKCYYVNSHRAAVILAWMATADCLRRRLEELKREGDMEARNAVDSVLTPLIGQASFEENLITQSRKCELFDDYEERCLRFARDTRSKCAHPSGVVPSAEAVRHILEICSQVVLCRRGYRGVPFIKNIVTVQFDDPYFLSSSLRIKENCLDIFSKVPLRLWSLFTTLAAEERPEALGEVWRSNALIFFKHLLEECKDDFLAAQIARGMQGFEAGAADFFALLVGLDSRVGKFWDRVKRDQARGRLVNGSLVQLVQAKQQDIISWANICTQDGLEHDDINLLKQRIGVMSKYFPKEFLQTRSVEIYEILVEKIEDDSSAVQAAAALNHLLPSVLGQAPDVYNKEKELSPGDRIETILKRVIQRFPESSNKKFRTLLENIQQWNENFLIAFLKLSEDFLLDRSEDEYEDIYYLFEAASALAEHNPLRVPTEFDEAIKATLEGRIQKEWRTNSEAGRSFKGQLELLFSRYYSSFIDLQRECQPLLAAYILDNENELDFDNEGDNL